MLGQVSPYHARCHVRNPKEREHDDITPSFIHRKVCHDDTVWGWTGDGMMEQRLPSRAITTVSAVSSTAVECFTKHTLSCHPTSSTQFRGVWTGSTAVPYVSHQHNQPPAQPHSLQKWKLLDRSSINKSFPGSAMILINMFCFVVSGESGFYFSVQTIRYVYHMLVLYSKHSTLGSDPKCIVVCLNTDCIITIFDSSLV